MASYRQQAPAPLLNGSSFHGAGNIDNDYDYQVASPSSNNDKPFTSLTGKNNMMSPSSTSITSPHSMATGNSGTPSQFSVIAGDGSGTYRYDDAQHTGIDLDAPGNDTSNNGDDNGGAIVDGDEALQDLAQLEELHVEAEKLKALGNKHMAGQEYTRAYNAYSAALQLSPVGPSSHVFLSNRAAALLSLKRYNAAATDARRAITLAPTFGKAHARLGQALYFLKDYAGAVDAYEDALLYEPDNQVTRTYLEKAKIKMEKQRAKQQHQATRIGIEEMSLNSATTGTTTTIHGYTPSIATDPNFRENAIVQSTYRGDRTPLISAAIANHDMDDGMAGGVSTPNTSMNNSASPTAAGLTESTMPHLSPDNNKDSSNAHQVVNNNVYNNPVPVGGLGQQDDPDFEEAIRIQHRANQYLANKDYKAAIEEYTAALFLVPDDPVLSPDLHLGRAHALNGSRRHERAKNDALLAVKLQPSPAAYSTLAKSLFYMKEYRQSVEAFQKCVDLLPHGESLGMFDRAYMQKAEAAVEEEEASLKQAGMVSSGKSVATSSSNIPKLPPPRFVPREEAIQSVPNVPPMPKQWPQQSPRTPSAFRCGPERNIVFLSESLGIKLNRGADGIVRVLWVAPEMPGSKLARQGKISVGDVIREVGGVDLRRPITNIMWGDTVALVKMAPRPITFIVAQELSETPVAVLEEIQKANEKAAMAATINGGSSTPPNGLSKTNTTTVPPESAFAALRPSPASTEDAVQHDEKEEGTNGASTPADNFLPGQIVEKNAPVSVDAAGVDANSSDAATAEEAINELQPDTTEEDDNPYGEKQYNSSERPNNPIDWSNIPEASNNPLESTSIPEESQNLFKSDEEPHQKVGPEANDNVEPVVEGDDAAIQFSSVDTVDKKTNLVRDKSLLDEDVFPDKALLDEDESGTANTNALPIPEGEKIIAGEILFERNAPPSYGGWDNLRWLSYSGVRIARFCQDCYRLAETEKKQFFFSRLCLAYEKRFMAIYEEPKLILVLRRPSSSEEVHELLGLPDIAELDDAENALENYFIVESVADPTCCKLRMSPLTTPFSLGPNGADQRRLSCFELITPSESICLSTVKVRDGVKCNEKSFGDSGAYLETFEAETELAKFICGSHEQAEKIGLRGEDISWKHSLILGTLFSLVVSGDLQALDDAINHIKTMLKAAGEDASVLPAHFIDAVDDNGLGALYYACAQRNVRAAETLVRAGARVDVRIGAIESTLAHICSINLDHKTLSTVLSIGVPSRLDPNLTDKLGRTPMYLAATEGRTVSGGSDPLALSKCLMALEAWGGQMMSPDNLHPLQHPVSVLSRNWSSESLSVALSHIKFRYPLISDANGGNEVFDLGVSVSAAMGYPVHCALLSLGNYNGQEGEDEMSIESRLIRTLRVLLEHGFEPNGRLDVLDDLFWSNEYNGCTPIQILTLVAMGIKEKKESTDGNIYNYLRVLIEDTAEFLVRCGARSSIDAPPSRRLRRSTSNTSEEGKVTVGVKSKLKSASKQDLSEILGNSERLKEAQKEWGSLQPVPASSQVDLLRDDKVSFSDNDAPGGNNEKSCAICWKDFGLVNRKHRCRITRRFVCDTCSSKRIIADGVDFRISDGQFLLARIDAAKEQSAKAQALAEREEHGGLTENQGEAELPTESDRSDTSKARLGKFLRLSKRTSSSSEGKPKEPEVLPTKEDKKNIEDEANRESLFGNLMGQASKILNGEEGDQASKTTSGLKGLASSMNETRNALLERGEKISNMGEKSSQLVEQSSDFARMAKELRQKTESRGIFW